MKSSKTKDSGQITIENLIKDPQALIHSNLFRKFPKHIRSHNSQLGNGKFIYVKGLDGFSSKYSRVLAGLDSRKYRGGKNSYLYHFSSFEEKVPAILKLSEANIEFSIAKKLQESHLRKTNKLLRIPNPVYIGIADEKIHTERIADLALTLDPVRFANVSNILTNDKIAYYVYTQEDHPLRLEDYLDKKSWFYLRDDYPYSLDFLKSFRSWLYIYFFFLSENFLVLHDENIGLGTPIDMGNLCLSGGVADVGTCLQIDSRTENSFIKRSLDLSYEAWANIVKNVFRKDDLSINQFILSETKNVIEQEPHLNSPLLQQWYSLALKQSHSDSKLDSSTKYFDLESSI